MSNCIKVLLSAVLKFQSCVFGYIADFSLKIGACMPDSFQISDLKASYIDESLTISSTCSHEYYKPSRDSNFRFRFFLLERVLLTPMLK